MESICFAGRDYSEKNVLGGVPIRLKIGSNRDFLRKGIMQYVSQVQTTPNFNGETNVVTNDEIPAISPVACWGRLVALVTFC